MDQEILKNKLEIVRMKCERLILENVLKLQLASVEEVLDLEAVNLKNL